ncbi:MAG: nitrite reductase [Marmoricola sp.]|nr:nitrite reductase [Marmoricola sp.]
MLRPWLADDGALVRVRLVGGRLPTSSLGRLLEVAATYGDGDVHLTKRANLQLRAMPHDEGDLPTHVINAIAATGLLPWPSHELVRNVMLSPASGLDGGLADLRPVADELDRRLCAEPALADLPGRFLFVLDDGRGDLVARSCDLGLVALDPHHAQVRLGSMGWGPVVPIDEAAHALVGLARLFLRLRGDGPAAPWHVDELDDELDHLATTRDPRVPGPVGPMPYGDTTAWTHLEVPGGRLTAQLARDLLDSEDDLVVTPWHGVLRPHRAAR